MLGLDDNDHPITKLPRYTDSTVLPSTEISGGLGPEPMFCSFVFGQEMLSPRCEAESLKLLSDVVASVADGRSKAVSSAYTRSVNVEEPAVIPGWQHKIGWVLRCNPA